MERNRRVFSCARRCVFVLLCLPAAMPASSNSHAMTIFSLVKPFGLRLEAAPDRGIWNIHRPPPGKNTIFSEGRVISLFPDFIRTAVVIDGVPSRFVFSFFSLAFFCRRSFPSSADGSAAPPPGRPPLARAAPTPAALRGPPADFCPFCLSPRFSPPPYPLAIRSSEHPPLIYSRWFFSRVHLLGCARLRGARSLPARPPLPFVGFVFCY
jgi:hypothetical protein